jgi:hypothetical protein
MSALVTGPEWGRLVPPKPQIPPLAEDARTHVLERFADYLACIAFQVPNPPGPNAAYQIPRDRILVEWPDDDQTAMKFPTLTFEPGRFELLPKGLTPAANEASRDRFGPGTVLVSSYEYVELVTLAVWSSTRSQRRTMLAGIEWALTPTEAPAGISIHVPSYYGEVAHFEAKEGQNIDVEDSMRRLRRSELVFEMSFDLVRLVRVDTIEPRVEVAVFEQSDPVGYEEALALLPRNPGSGRR